KIQLKNPSRSPFFLLPKSAPRATPGRPAAWARACCKRTAPVHAYSCARDTEVETSTGKSSEGLKCERCASALDAHEWANKLRTRALRGVRENASCKCTGDDRDLIGVGVLGAMHEVLERSRERAGARRVRDTRASDKHAKEGGSEHATQAKMRACGTGARDPIPAGLGIAKGRRARAGGTRQERSARVQGQRAGRRVRLGVGAEDARTKAAESPGRIARRLKLEPTKVKRFGVKVANGHELKGNQLFKKVQITAQDQELEIDLYALSLKAIDIVLGVQWLETLGPITIDYRRGKIEFGRPGRRIKLRTEDQGDSPIEEDDSDVDVLNYLILGDKESLEEEGNDTEVGTSAGKSSESERIKCEGCASTLDAHEWEKGWFAGVRWDARQTGCKHAFSEGRVAWGAAGDDCDRIGVGVLGATRRTQKHGASRTEAGGVRNKRAMGEDAPIGARDIGERDSTRVG
ncbi:Unknown protein, partial [Striga hermonthica]